MCSEECPEGTYGTNCSQRCSCKNGATCDRVTGACKCGAGFSGSQCEKPCNIGFFGANCTGECACLNDAICSPSTGACQCRRGFSGNKCETRSKFFVCLVIACINFANGFVFSVPRGPIWRDLLQPLFVQYGEYRDVSELEVFARRSISNTPIISGVIQ